MSAGGSVDTPVRESTFTVVCGRRLPAPASESGGAAAGAPAGTTPAGKLASLPSEAPVLVVGSATTGPATSRKLSKSRYTWGYFEEGTEEFSVGARAMQVFFLFCTPTSRAAKDAIHGRLDAMPSHLRDCLAAPVDVRSVASESSDSGRKHRRLAGSIPRTPGDGAVVGPMDALIPRTYSARHEPEFELDLLRVLLFSSIAFNILDGPPFRVMLRKRMPGIKRIPRRRAMSGPVLQRLLEILTTNAKSVYLRGA